MVACIYYGSCGFLCYCYLFGCFAEDSQGEPCWVYMVHLHELRMRNKEKEQNSGQGKIKLKWKDNILTVGIGNASHMLVFWKLGS